MGWVLSASGIEPRAFSKKLDDSNNELNGFTRIFDEAGNELNAFGIVSSRLAIDGSAFAARAAAFETTDDLMPSTGSASSNRELLVPFHPRRRA
jgi:hypothetical protein